MSKIVTLPTKTLSASLRHFVRSAFTMDPVATKMLDNTFVSVHLSSRIWMV